MQQTMKLASRLGIGAARVPRQVQRGASLLEAIAYLGIAAIVVIGAVVLLNNAFNSESTNELAQQVSALQTGVKKLYLGQTGGYASVTTPIVYNAGVFPSNTTNDGKGNVTDSWGGAVLIAPSASTNTQFTISYATVPQAVCVNAVSASGNWVSISINGNVTTTVPVDPKTASSECTSGSTNTIVWTSS